MKTDNIYVLMMVYVDENWMDLAGNKYQEKGFICSKDFTVDENIQYGLYGILWGKTDTFIYEENKNGHWLIVKTEKNNNMIKVDQFSNRYKFREGSILHSGNINSCSKFILMEIKNNENDYLKECKDLSPEDVAGTKEWRQKNKNKVVRV